MKRIVNGTTYNTDTSTALARCEFEPDSDGVETVETLYLTRGGAYFIDQENTRTIWNERERENETKVTNTFIPESPETAHKWMMTAPNVEVFRNPFEDPPEAEAEAEPGATIYIRVPAALKRNVDDAAKAAKVSGNVWTMRCVEKCLRGLSDDIVRAWAIASNFRAYANVGQWERETCIEALSEIADLIDDYANAEHGDDSVLSDAVGSDRFQEWVKKYQPSSEALSSISEIAKKTSNAELAAPSTPGFKRRI